MAWSTDPACSGLYQPRPPRSDDIGEYAEYMEEYFDWIESCTVEETGETDGGEEPPEEPPYQPPPPPPCEPARWTTASGKCFERICTLDGPVVRRCSEPDLPTHPNAFPIIDFVGLTARGFFVSVIRARGEQPVVQHVSPGKIKLLPIIRAMFSEAQLPSFEIKKVSEDFWARQEKVGRISEFSILDARGIPVRLLGKKSASPRQAK